MGIFALALFAFGLYSIVSRLVGRRPTRREEEFAGRLGRSIHGAMIATLPGLAGQSSSELAAGPLVDEIGTEEHHRSVLGASRSPSARPARATSGA